MVEVDPRLFVTCRLCLDVQGHFQIDPTVQQLIKYCFDIDVEPFDRLPQLICRKCKIILKEHNEIKKKFNEKQAELKTKLRGKLNKSPLQRPEESDSSTSSMENIVKRKKKHVTKKVKKKRSVKRLLSTSCDDSDTHPCSLETKQKYKCDQSSEKWDVNLNKYFVCRICSQGFKDKSDIIKHTNEHSKIQMKYKNVFKMSCLVVMEKSDGKPNTCNNDESVVQYSSDCIIQNKHNPFYYIVYHPKTYSLSLNDCKSISLKRKLIHEETTDSDTISYKRRSSSETVVLNRHSEHEDISQRAVSKPGKIQATVIDCIDLADSSDNASYESNEKTSSLNNFKIKKTIDSKHTHNIIKMCHNKYAKKIDSLVLQHKVLSIGRKIINNKGFNCIGLLRYLEYKDLSVIWKEASILKASGDGKFVRIATRKRGYETTDANELGWKNVKTFNYDYEDTDNSINILKKLKLFTNFKKIKKIKEKPLINEEATLNSVEQNNMPIICSVYSHTDLEITKNDTDSMLQKLLNENPVSNPKQLPKKVNNSESVIKNLRVFSGPKGCASSISAKQTDENNEINSNVMPIVTSTVSLAPLSDKKETTSLEDPAIVSKNVPQSLYPRIKVKPVSELMPEKTTNINSTEISSNEVQNEIPLNESSYNIVAINSKHKISNVWSNQNSEPLNERRIWPNQDVSFIRQQTWDSQNIVSNDQNRTVKNGPAGTNFTDGNKECLLLDTVEFPNTRTSSPFAYLKNLLMVHKIILVDPDKPIPSDSKCLIKLKLVYQQEACQPVTLCLSLFYSKREFCIKVRDVRERDVNVFNLSAHWQWQLLKIYSDNVIDKVLQTASKLNVESHQYTKKFFTLLKSIKLIDT